MNWISPRIWRSGKSRFYDDEVLHAHEIYTDDEMQRLCENGFDAIWIRGVLRNLTHSAIFPEIDNDKAELRIKSLKTVIARGLEHGVKVYLYFNEPLALNKDDAFFKNHSELAGASFAGSAIEGEKIALCTSVEKVKNYFAESVRNMFSDLSGLGGVILLTASEFYTHCWSWTDRRRSGQITACDRCKDREPADIVGELVKIWNDCARQVQPSPAVWAWNWSWSQWYDEPQSEMLQKFPENVKILSDFERGSVRKQKIGDVFIDEYSLGFCGPSERFLGLRDNAKRRGVDVCAKLQIGTTHELATVPNLPLIPNIFEKLRWIDRNNIKGIMGSWCFGNSYTVNTYALKIFVECPEIRNDKEAFLGKVVSGYFGGVNIDKVLKAWKCFCDSFGQYPFSIPFLYYSPLNYAPVYPLLFRYEDRPLGPAWIWHEKWGDKFDICISKFGPKPDQIIECLQEMESNWKRGLDFYSAELTDMNEHQAQELRCAKMIYYHICAALNIFKFDNWRKSKMENACPCNLSCDDISYCLVKSQIAVAQRALELCSEDDRFGYHQEAHAYFYDPQKIKDAIALMSQQPEFVSYPNLKDQVRCS